MLTLHPHLRNIGKGRFTNKQTLGNPPPTPPHPPHLFSTATSELFGLSDFTGTFWVGDATNAVLLSLLRRSGFACRRSSIVVWTIIWSIFFYASNYTVLITVRIQMIIHARHPIVFFRDFVSVVIVSILFSIRLFARHILHYSAKYDE